MSFKPCKKLLLILALLLWAQLLWAGTGSAYAAEAEIGTVPMILRSVSANGKKSALDDEISLGNAAADAIRWASGADVAIVNGGVLAQNLQAGLCAEADLEASIPTDQELVLLMVTADQLWSVLEQGLSHEVLDEDRAIDRRASAYDGFPQVSGLSVTSDLSMPEGDQLYAAELADGTEIREGDSETLVTLCVSREMYEGGYGYTVTAEQEEPLELTLRTAMKEYIASGAINAVAYDKESRIHLIGCKDDRLIYSEPELIILILLVLCLISLRKTILEKLKHHRTR